MWDRLSRWWRKTTTQPCAECGAEVPVIEYRRTGEYRKGTWWSGGGEQLECPNCGASFWVKK